MLRIVKEISSVKSGAIHGFFPDFYEIHTGFSGWGAGFNKKKSIPFMGLEDISPLITELLDIPFNAPDGELYSELLKTSEKEPGKNNEKRNGKSEML